MSVSMLTKSGERYNIEYGFNDEKSIQVNHCAEHPFLVGQCEGLA